MTINQRDHVVGLLDHEEWNLQLQAREKVGAFDPAKLRRAVDQYANAATRKRFREWLHG